MTVYIDDMYLYPVGKLGRMKMSHMIADTQSELIAMAVRLGLKKNWIQKAGTHQEHFDVALGNRRRAIAAGANPITMRQCALMCRRRAVTGALGTPESIAAWADQHFEEARQNTA